MPLYNEISDSFLKIYSFIEYIHICTYPHAIQPAASKREENSGTDVLKND